jgi:toxin ParE1/3/4
MAKYRLSHQAVSDLESIAEYTIRQFGLAQARQYRDSLKSCLEQLADNPEIGPTAEQLAHGLKRFSHQSHVVFYLQEADGLLIVRILHSRMEVPQHF